MWKTGVVTYLLVIVMGSSVFMFGCTKWTPTAQPADSVSTEVLPKPQMVSSPSKQSSTSKGVMVLGKQELEKQLNLYMLANSDVALDDACGFSRHGFPHDERIVLEYYRQANAVGLVARAYLEQAGDAAVSLIVERLKDALEEHDGCDDRPDPLASFLGSSGIPALKADVRLGNASAPESDDDAEWMEFLEGTSHELLWHLNRDAAALAASVKLFDDDIEYSQTPDYCTPDEMSVFGEYYLMRQVLAISPVDGGISNDKLQQWRMRSPYLGVRWVADLALARRGDVAAVQRVRDNINSRFPITSWERTAYKYIIEYPVFYLAREGAQFLFVRELAKSSLEDRWELLLDLLGDTDSHLLAPRAGVLVALDDHWDQLPAVTQRQARRLVVGLHWTETNEWLLTMMRSFLAAHPADTL